ncbi:MAG: HAD family phosphatase [Euryarchaeota archaeon]|nr:HAD family phosphatase [Euryarchaeota archaeon]
MSSGRIVIFDLDGTLIKENSAWEMLHDHFEVDKGIVEENKRLYDEGIIDVDRWIEIDIKLWKRPHRKEIEKSLTEYSLINGIHEFVDYLKEREFIVGIVSSGIDILAEKVANELGIEICYSNSFIFDEKGFLTGGKGNVDLLRKKKILKRISQEIGTPLEEFVMIGDTKYDMVEGVGTTIALNSKGKLKADYTVSSVQELREIFEREI